jgi:hypothetical protein
VPCYSIVSRLNRENSTKTHVVTGAPLSNQVPRIDSGSCAQARPSILSPSAVIAYPFHLDERHPGSGSEMARKSAAGSEFFVVVPCTEGEG